MPLFDELDIKSHFLVSVIFGKLCERVYFFTFDFNILSGFPCGKHVHVWLEFVF